MPKRTKEELLNEITILSQARLILVENWGGNCKPKNFLMSCGECRARVAIRCIDETLEFHREDLAEYEKS